MLLDATNNCFQLLFVYILLSLAFFFLPVYDNATAKIVEMLLILVFIGYLLLDSTGDCFSGCLFISCCRKYLFIFISICDSATAKLLSFLFIF